MIKIDTTTTAAATITTTRQCTSKQENIDLLSWNLLDDIHPSSKKTAGRHSIALSQFLECLLSTLHFKTEHVRIIWQGYVISKAPPNAGFFFMN